MLTALCNQCYTEIPAELEYDEAGAWLVKECSDHGIQRERMDTDAEVFRLSLVKGPDAEEWYKYIGVTCLDVTDKCNVQCPHCYALPNNKLKDKSIESLVEISRMAVKGGGITLMGAEPTMRSDLGELVSALKKDSGKPINIVTNAIRLAEPGFLEEQCSEVHSFCVSLHGRNYLPNPKIFDQKLVGLDLLHKSGHPLTWLAFTLPVLDDIEEAIDIGLEFKGFAQHIRLRSPGKTGICDTPPFDMSQLTRRFYDSMRLRGFDVAPFPSDNNPYHMNFLANGQLWRLICAPSVETIVLEYLQTPPWALLVPELGETNLAHQGIVQVGIKEGKFKWK